MTPTGIIVRRKSLCCCNVAINWQPSFFIPYNWSTISTPSLPQIETSIIFRRKWLWERSQNTQLGIFRFARKRLCERSLSVLNPYLYIYLLCLWQTSLLCKKCISTCANLNMMVYATLDQSDVKNVLLKVATLMHTNANIPVLVYFSTSSNLNCI